MKRRANPIDQVRLVNKHAPLSNLGVLIHAISLLVKAGIRLCCVRTQKMHALAAIVDDEARLNSKILMQHVGSTTPFETLCRTHPSSAGKHYHNFSDIEAVLLLRAIPHLYGRLLLSHTHSYCYRKQE